MKKYQPAVLLILDGWGVAPLSQGNAVALAKTPNFDRLWKNFPHTLLDASNGQVGLPENQPGNSEAGHMNIGAGHIVFQDSVIINRAIDDKSFFNNMALKHVVNHILAKKSRLHLMGLISDGESPHSSLNHLLALVKLARLNKISEVYLHLFTDGRDSPQHSAMRIVVDLMKKINNGNNGSNGVTKIKIASLMGRFFAMDRAKNWERTRLAYECLVSTKNVKVYQNYKLAIEEAYNRGLTDEYIEPCIINGMAEEIADSRIKDHDAIIFFNLRSDRARQLAKCFSQKDFNKKNPQSFKRSKILKDVLFCALTDFGPDLSENLITAYPGVDEVATMPFMMNSFRQLYIAESEKYAHVTYFLNGGYPDPVYNEKRIRIMSPKVKNYKDKPEMSAYKISQYICKNIEQKKADFIVANFANPDMVGHTGDLKATIKAVEHVDKCLGEISRSVLKNNGVLFVTADHGNAEKMIDLETGEIFTEHTQNPVPFILIDNKNKKIKLRKNGNLGDIAPTIYDFLKLPNKSNHVVGKSLIKK